MIDVIVRQVTEQWCFGRITFKMLQKVVKTSVFLLNTRYTTTKLRSRRKVSDAAENLQLYWVVLFFRPRSSCTMHLMLFSERPPIYASCMTISGERTEQHVIIAGFLVHHWLYKWFSSTENVRDICVVHDDLGWKNRTTRCNRFWKAGCSQLEYVDIRSIY